MLENGVDMSHDLKFMEMALEQARLAGSIGEVPIGAVVVFNGEIVGRGHNRREIDRSPSAHAEFLAIEDAAKRLGRWRLSGCTVYVTVEPCLMCAGLMHQARIDRCVFAAADPKAGALGTLYSFHEDERLNHVFEVSAGVCEAESEALLKDFFKSLRARTKLDGKREKPEEGKLIAAGAEAAAELADEEINLTEFRRMARPNWMTAQSPRLSESVNNITRVYEGPIFVIDRLDVRFPDGNTGKRDVVRHPGAAAVLVIDEQGRALLTRQWRTALGRINTEIPAGKIDPGESPEFCARRELIEETGVNAHSLTHLTTITTTAGFADEYLHIYSTRDFSFTQAGSDDDEFIELLWRPFDELVEAARGGIIEDAKTVVALLLEHAREQDHGD